MESKIITLPVPPSDNRRLIIARGRMILSNEARSFLRDGMVVLKTQWPRGTILVPSFNHQLHISVKAFVPSWRGDCSNFTKLLKDVMTGTVYDDDKFVHINYEDTQKDQENPRLEISVPVDRFSVGHIEEPADDLREPGCVCAYPFLLRRGWPEWGIVHHPKCPLYRLHLLNWKHLSRGCTLRTRKKTSRHKVK
jgi:Holliday junction resolvase RusA-like endonuclease